MRAIDGEFPLAPEVTFLASLGRGRNDGDKQRAVADLLADLVVPRISAAQLALVEPDLDAARPQRLANAPRRLGILRGVAQEYGLPNIGHGILIRKRSSVFSDSSHSAMRGLLVGVPHSVP